MYTARFVIELGVVKVRGSTVQDHPQLYSEFEVSLGDMRPCLKTPLLVSFSLAVIKYSNKSNLMEKGLIVAHGSRSSPSIQGSENSWGLEDWLASHPLPESRERLMLSC